MFCIGCNIDAICKFMNVLIPPAPPNCLMLQESFALPGRATMRMKKLKQQVILDPGGFSLCGGGSEIALQVQDCLLILPCCRH